ncbi:MAG: hypothetical protein KF756_02825 [Acidobacteria bacterium]|nr:hypothetical protein [Acidobacteriota bacterium]
MAILFGIDGTGPVSNATYAADFKNSFVHQMCTNNNYERGPIGPGGGLPEAIESGMRYITKLNAVNKSEPILLTGYSRGALGAVVIAKRLQDLKIPVYAMVLFDCVDRHLAFDAEFIPNTVANVLHIRRDPSARSRMSFGNDGTKYSAPTKYIEKFYFGTHGAMGGTYWKPTDGQGQADYIDEGTAEAVANTPVGNPFTYGSRVSAYKTNVTFRQDKLCSTQIARENSAWLTSHGFPGITCI